MHKRLLNTALASECLEKIGRKKEGDKTKISELMEDFSENGILLVMIFFSLPIAVPLPYPPGFTTILGIPLMILSIQMIVGSKKVRLPSRINNYEIKNSTLKMISDKTVPIIRGIEKYIKPRLSFAQSVYCERFIGVVCLIAAFSVALPIPFTNAIPALGIVVMSLGLLNRDGIVIIAGLTITMIGVLVAFIAIIMSYVGIKSLFYAIFKTI